MERRFTKMKVWVNGTFDVVHLGHIRLLEFASKFGEVRVGIDEDERVREKKGNSRPINTIRDRVEFISSIKYVQSVTSFSTDSELKDRIEEYGTDIMIVGEEYKDRQVIGSELVKEVVFFPKLEGYSTTKILKGE